AGSSRSRSLSATIPIVRACRNRPQPEASNRRRNPNLFRTVYNCVAAGMQDSENSTVDPVSSPEAEAVAAAPPSRATLWGALSWFRDLALSVLIAVILIVFIYQPVKVEGTSMMPTL